MQLGLKIGLKIKVLVAGAAAGAALILLLQQVLLPAIARAVTPERRVWMLNTFSTHPAGFLLGIIVGSAILGLPAFLAALWLLNPKRRRK